MTTVCVVGSGGREHALATVLARDAAVTVSPGNPGIAGSTASAPTDIEADLFVIGPEQPLVDGLADRLRAQGKLVFGPGADGAQLEGSKAWMKDLLMDAGVATATHGTFDSLSPALDFLDTMSAPYVIKTDGLAAGKGVLVTASKPEARQALGSYLSGEAFGDAGRTVVIEEGLVGPEISLLAICDGKRAVALAPAQDFKRIGNRDMGANTGGMGAYSPVAVADEEFVSSVMDKFVAPTLDALRDRGIDYRGVLYAGLMLTPEGPKMLEYNVRFGDPETQAVLARLDSSLVELLMEAADGHLVSGPKFSQDAAVTVVCAAEGYPQSPRTGDQIRGIEAARRIEGVQVSAAGVAAGEASALVTAGGRVLSVTATAPSIAQARTLAYQAVDLIDWPGKQVRTDIALAAADPAKEKVV